MSDGPGPFTALTAVLLAVVGVFAFSAVMVLAAYAPDLKSGDDGQAQALSKSAVGFAGLVRVLRLAGDPVVINRGALPPGSRSGLLIVTATPGTDRKAIEALTFDGPVLAVLPKWTFAPDLIHKGWIARPQLIDGASIVGGSLLDEMKVSRAAGVVRPLLHGSAAFPRALRAGPIHGLQTLGAPGWIPLLADQTGHVVLARASTRPLFVLSDPDLLDTGGLRSVETMATALAIVRGLRAGDGPVIFDVRLNGLGQIRGVLRLLFDPPFLGVTLSLAAAALLAGLQAFCRFGPTRRGGRAIALGKTALVDNTAALIRLARREHRMGGRYADLTADLAARAVGAPRQLGGEALVALLDRLGAGRGESESLSQLSIKARSTASPAALTAVAGDLFRWRAAATTVARTPPPAQRVAH